jgi:hypothetical protein
VNALDQLNGYLQRLEKRLRFLAVSKGTSLVTVSALVITVLLVWIINRYAFSPASLLWARVLLFLSVAVAIAFGLVIPLLNLNRRNAARQAETKFPDFQQRLLTLAEKPNAPNAKPNAKNDPFLELLAADTMRVAASSEPERLASTGPIIGFLTSAGLAVAVLLWLILAGPGYLGYGTSLLWAGAPKAGNRAFYDIAVTPGDRAVRRKADQLVTAQLLGFDSAKVRLFAQYRGTSKWEQVDMQPTPGASTYEFLFSSLTDNVEYYIEAGAVQSKHYNLRVVDLPGIKKIRVTYHYPAWSGLKDSVEDPGGDLRAVEGTEAEVAILTDRPLNKGVLMLGDDRQIELKPKETKPGEGNWVTARVTLDKDGLYHIAAIDRGENVRLSEDFFIEARKDSPPTVKIDRPGRDAKVNPVEEVTITVNAEDDFALNDVSLHYSVNGGAEKTVSLLSQKGAKTSDGKYVLALEDYKLAPGDLISLYASAKDARNTTKTDIYFIQAEPFERNYSQAQSGGGGGAGGGENDQQISQRQKDMIAATWNEYKNGSKDPSVASDDAKFLSEQEGKLAAQAKSLADRMKARELADANPQFQSFTKEMEEASKSMIQSAEKIKSRKWNDAMPLEQKALQEAQRAEATFRDIQVAFGAQGGGGGGAGGAGRDLENLADLELDREKNQYETGQQSASDSRSQEIDKALQKLAELARRQQELAAKKDQQQPFRQRWEQEMLRREAEQLQKQMEQLQRGDSSQQQSSSQPGQKGQPGQAGQSGQPSQQSGQQSGQSGGSGGRTGSIASPQLQQALDRLKKATEDMQGAEQQQNGSPEQTAAGQRRAADRLQEARDILNGMQHQNASQQLDDLAQQASQLSQQQGDFQTRLRKMVGSSPDENPRFGSQGLQNQQQAERLATEKNEMADKLKKLEQGMTDAARSLAGAQNPVGNKLRDALGEAQQSELEMHMRQNAQWIRQGYGSTAWVRENGITLGLNNLRDQLQQAQAAMQQSGKPGQGPGGDSGDLEKALARVQAMRDRMQQLAQNQGKGQPGQGRQSNPLQRGNQSGNSQQPGQQPGQSQPGQNGQPGQGQEGQGQQGQGQGQGQGQQTGQNGNGYAPYGGGGAATPGNGNDGPPPIEQAYRESLRDLNQLRDFVRANPDVANDYSNLSRALNPQFATNDGELTQRLNHEVLPEIERLELELRRKLEDKNSDQVRSAGQETVPPGYSDAVADYFRKLSKGK